MRAPLVTIIHRDEEHRLSRRAFLHMMFLASAALGLASPPLGSLARWAERSGPNRSPEPAGTPIAGVDDIKPGARVPLHWPDGKVPAEPTNLPEGRFVAYDRRCSHPLCPGLSEPGLDRMVCPCQDGHFNARTGQVLLGPPRRPLPVINRAVRDGGLRPGRRTPGGKTDGAQRRP